MSSIKFYKHAVGQNHALISVDLHSLELTWKWNINPLALTIFFFTVKTTFQTWKVYLWNLEGPVSVGQCRCCPPFDPSLPPVLTREQTESAGLCRRPRDPARPTFRKLESEKREVEVRGLAQHLTQVAASLLSGVFYNKDQDRIWRQKG